MAVNDFKVTGKGTAPSSGDLATDINKMMIGVFDKGVMKAITNDIIVMGGSLDQAKLSAKIGLLKNDHLGQDPSGILGRSGEYVYDVKQLDKALGGSEQYMLMEFTIKAAILQSILIEEGILTLPSSEEPEEEEATTPAEQQEEIEQEEEQEESAAEEEEEEASDEQPLEITPSPPSVEEEKKIQPTHRVRTQEDPLRIRQDPSFSGKILGKMPKGTKVHVVDEYLGKKCEWNEIIMVDLGAKDASDGKELIDKFKYHRSDAPDNLYAGRIYAHASYLKPLSNTPKSLAYTCDFEMDRHYPREPRWRNKDPNGFSCFYNKKWGTYETVIETAYQSESDLDEVGLTFEKLREESFVLGVEKLLNYYYKWSDKKSIEAILGAYRGPYIPNGAAGFHLDRRPGSFMKFLVAFPAKYFNAIPSRAADLSLMTENQPDSNLRSIHFDLDTLKPNIEIVAQQMQVFDEEIKESKAEIVTLDLAAERKRLLELPAVIAELLKENDQWEAAKSIRREGRSFSNEAKKNWSVEIGITEDFAVKWVLLGLRGERRGESKSFPLNISMGSALYGFRRVEPINSRRTIAYLWYLDKMVKAVKTKTIPKSEPNPEAAPAAEAVPDPQTESAADVPDWVADELAVAHPESPTPDALTWTGFVSAFTYPIPKIFPEGRDPEHSPQSDKEAQDAAAPVSKNPKTTTEKDNEAKRLSDPDKKLKAASERKKVANIIGDNLFQDVDHVLAKAGCSIDSIFNEILNKYGVTGLVALVRSCLPLPEPSIDAQLACMEKSLPIAVAAAKASVDANFTTGSLSETQRKKILLDYVLKADPIAALDCIQLPELPDIALPNFDLPNLDFQIPSLPTLELPDNLSISDPMGFVMPALDMSIDDALAGILCELIATILESISCGGLQDLASTFGEFTADITDATVADTLDKMGLDEPTDEAAQLVASTVRGCTAPELAALLEGNASAETRQRIKALARGSAFMSSDAQIDDFFRTLGGFIDPAAFAAARTPVSSNFQPSLTGLLCDNDGDFQDSYSSLLSDRLRGNRAQEQIDAEAARMRDLAEQLDDILADVDSVIPDSLSDPVDVCDSLPPVPALDKMISSVVDSIFAPTKIAFNGDAAFFLKNLIFESIRPLKLGDPGYITKADGKDLWDWNENRVSQENAVKQRRFEEVAPYIRDSLIGSKDNFNMLTGNVGDGEGMQIKMNTGYPIRMEPPVAPSETAKIKEKIFYLEKEFKHLIEQRASFEQDGIVDDAINARIRAILYTLHEEPDFSELGEIRQLGGGDDGGGGKPLYAQLAESVTVDTVNANIKKSFDLLDPIIKTPASMMLEIPNTDDANRGFRDQFRIRLSTPSAMLENDEELTALTPLLDVPLSIPIPPGVEVWADGNNTPQAEAFASFVINKFIEGGHTIVSDISPPDTHLYKALKEAHMDIYQNLFAQVARQVSNSPLFEIDKLNDIQLNPPSGAGESICPPSDADGHLLDIFNIMQEMKDEYEELSCELIGRGEDESGAFERTCRTGAVKLVTRVYMLEALLKSIFCFSEFKVGSILGDRVIIEYVLHNLEEGLKRFNPEFYKDVALEAKEMIRRKVLGNIPLESDSFNWHIIDMDALLNEENPVYATGTEALKYIAVEQLSDLVAKLEDRFDKRTPNIHRRFTDIPAPECRDDDESTPEGGTVRTPLREGGWIRTIDVPQSYRYGLGNERFQRSRWIDSDQWRTEAAEQQIKERYPDMVRSGGTFFLERYIRIEDLEKPGPTHNSELLEVLRNRSGGPDNFDQLERDQRHLSGVVNIKEWKIYIDSLKSQPDAEPHFDITSEKITDYFKPWKYGLRLVWVPKFNPGIDTSLESNEWKRLDESAMDLAFSFSLGMGELKTDYDFELGVFLESPLFGDLAVGLFEEISGIDARPETEDWHSANRAFGAFQKTLIEERIKDMDINPYSQQREKTFAVIEQLERKTTIDTRETIVLPIELGALEASVSLPEFGTLHTFEDYGERTVYVFPLTSVEAEVQLSESSLNAASQLEEQTSKPAFAKLRKDLILSDDYRFLFEYVFPLPRMLSLMTIYNGNSLSLSKPSIDESFNNTKKELEKLFNILSPNEEEEWWMRQPAFTAEVGGNAGLHNLHMNNMTAKGPSIDLLQLALMAVPILVRGCAEQLDSHYSLVSKLVDAGLPGKKDMTKVLPFWPVTFPFGWGPPITPLGLAAYGLAHLPGDDATRRKNENKAQPVIGQSPDPSVDTGIDEDCDN